MMSSLNDKNSPFRVCLILPTTFPSIGGYENLVYDLSMELSKKIEVHIICSNYDNKENLPISKNVVIHEFPLLQK